MAAVGTFIATNVFGFVAGSTAAAITAAIVNTSLFVGLSALTTSLFAPRAGALDPRDRVIKSGSQPKIVVYGTALVGGVLSYANVRRINTDTDYEYWVQIVHAAHEVEDITDIHYDSDVLDSGGDLAWSGEAGTLSAGNWYATNGSDISANLYRRFGTSTQAVLSDLDSAFSEISTAHQLRGYAYTAHRLKYFDESQEVFANGDPQNIRAMVKGKNDIYDPRLDTGGAGDDPTNASFAAWTENPVLIAVDYLRTYWGFADDRFDWDHIEAQADKCEISVSTPGGAQSRYTCNGVISLGDTHNVNMAKILACCLGRRSTVNGKIRITVGDDQTADVTLDETDIIGPVKVRTALPRNERYNTVVGTYNSADFNWQETGYIPVTDAGFVSRDNGETINRTFNQPLVTNEYQAQRNAFKLLQQSDQQIIAEVPLRWSGLRLTPGTYVSLTYSKFSWSSKLFRCTELKIGERGVPVTAILREDSASAWDDPTSPTDYSTRSAAGVINKATPVVPPPTSMTATAVQEGIWVDWVNPAGVRSYDYIDVYASADSSWSNASLVASNQRLGFFIHRVSGGDTRYYWVRAVKDGRESDREPNSDTSNRTATFVDRVVNNDDAFALGFNPHFENWPSGNTYPDGWQQWDSSSAPSRETTIKQIGSQSVQFDTNNANIGMFCEVDIDLPTESAVTCSVDVYIESGGTGTPTPIVAVSLYEGSNYFWGWAGADASITDTWQRVNVRVSKARYKLFSGPPTGDYDKINVTLVGCWDSVLGGNHVGTVYFDRLIFHVDGEYYVDATIDSDSKLSAGIEMYDGTAYRPVTHAMEADAAADGDSITFSQTYGTPPVVKFLSGGVGYNSSLSGDQAQEFNALSVSTSGFTASLKNKELAGTTTLRTDSTVSDPGSPAGPDLSINKGQTDEAYDDKYTFQFDVTVENYQDTGFWFPGKVTIEFYTNDGGGWVARGTRTFTGDGDSSPVTYSNQTKVITVDGLGLNDDFGISIISDLGDSASSITFDQVTYYTATAPTTESATPSGSTDVNYIVLEGE